MVIRAMEACKMQGLFQVFILFNILVFITCKDIAATQSEISVYSKPFFNMDLFNELFVFVGLCYLVLHFVSRVVGYSVLGYFGNIAYHFIYLTPFISFGIHWFIHSSSTGLGADMDKLFVYFLAFASVSLSFNAFKNTLLPLQDDHLHSKKRVSWKTQRKFKEYLHMSGHTSPESVLKSQQFYGMNKLDIPSESFIKLYFEQLTAPFFLFQVVCLFLWMLDGYWMYPLITILLTLYFEAEIAAQRLSNKADLKAMTYVEPREIYVYRESQWKIIYTNELVPGDLFSLTMVTGQERIESITPCDAILLVGSCTVNESILSGEATPILKDGIESEDPRLIWNEEEHGSSHALFSGTKLIQVIPSSRKLSRDSTRVFPTHGGCLAVVTKTGFNTVQGSIIKTIFDSKDRFTAQNTESYLFVFALMVFGCFTAYHVWTQSLIKQSNQNRIQLLIKCLLIITYVIPPELSVELTLAVNYSLSSLSKLNIYCTEPFRITLAGKADVVCFDKTGTLTEDKLTLKALFGLPVHNGEEIYMDLSRANSRVIFTLASCHSLIILKGASDNGKEPIGDYMEKAILESIDWELISRNVVYSKTLDAQIEIVKRFPFKSKLKRMSVVAKTKKQFTNRSKADLDGYYWFVAVKGAPESLEPLYRKTPSFYKERHTHYARKGFRVIAFGYKSINPVLYLEKFGRRDAESRIEYLGCLAFACKIKPDSKSVIQDLQASNHNVVIVSGDHPLTTMYVTENLGIVRHSMSLIDMDGNSDKLVFKRWSEENNTEDITPFDHRGVRGLGHVAITGKAFEQLYRQKIILMNILPFIAACARFSYFHKGLLLNCFKEMGLITVMCGDGTNDVDALKQAHVGVALLNSTPTEADIKKSKESKDRETPKFGDASIAAPFSSRGSSIDCVVNILRFGQGSLATTIQIYKILALICLIAAYSLSVLHLAGVRNSDIQDIIWDGSVAACFYFLTKTKVSSTLSKEKPCSTIFSLYPILSIIGQCSVHIYSLASFMSLPDFFGSSLEKVIINDEDQESSTLFKPSLQNSGIFILIYSMCISTFAINYQGPPYRESFFDNKSLFLFTCFSVVIVLLAIFEAVPLVNYFLQLAPFPTLFQFNLLNIIIKDIGLCFAVEKIAYRLLRNRGPLWKI